MTLAAAIRKANGGQTPKQSNNKNIIMFLKSNTTDLVFINQ
jgi:hypothetical protein